MEYLVIAETADLRPPPGSTTRSHLRSIMQATCIPQICRTIEAANGRIRKVNPTDVIATIAGTGNSTSGSNGDGGPAISAKLYEPVAVAVDAASNVYIAEFNKVRIRKVTQTGIITTIAGNATV